MKKNVLLSLAVQLVICLLSLPGKSFAGEVLIQEQGLAPIRGLLPDSWEEMPADKRAAFQRQNGKILEPAGKLLGVFHRKSDLSSDAPVMFVFHAAADHKVTAEQRDKMYAWFEKNREDVAWLVAPAQVKNMSLENIEYLHNRDTIIFDSSVEVDGRKMHGVSGIVFLERGYLNIIGYELDGTHRYRGDFYSFIKTLYVPEALKYVSGDNGTVDLASWFAGHWQKLVGALLFLVVYGLVFLRQGRNLR